MAPSYFIAAVGLSCLCNLYCINSYVTNGLRNIQGLKSRNYSLFMTEAAHAMENAPTDEKSRLELVCTGKSIDSPLFRAELKKELNFFRGCAGKYDLNPSTNVLEVVGEGKTKQLIRFLEWMKSMTTELNTRKPSFQGPAIMIKIDKAKWTTFQGDLKG